MFASGFRCRANGRAECAAKRAVCGAGAFCTVLAAAGAVLANPGAVSIAYGAPGGCPSKAAFVNEVSRRLSAVRVTDAAEADRHFEVDVHATPNDARARLRFVDTEGRKVERELRARDCREAAAGIALVTAVAIDPRLSLAEEPMEKRLEPEPSGASAPEAREPEAGTSVRHAPRAPAKRSAAPRSSLGATPSGPGVDSSAAPSTHEQGAGWSWFAGVTGGLVSDVAPVWAPAADVFTEMAPSRSFRARVGFGYADTGQFDLRGGLARFQLGVARAELCPVALRVSQAVAFRPCAGVEGGALRAEGRTSPRLAQPRSTPFVGWFTGIAALRAELELSRVFTTELHGQLRVPFLHHRYVFERPDEVVFETPDFGAGLMLSARGRIAE